MPALAQSFDEDLQTRAANDDDINGGPGTRTKYTYDSLNRVTQILYKNAGVTDQTLVFGYDAGTNGKGRLTNAGDGNHTLSWTYDALGRVVGKGQTVGTVAQSVGYGYTNGDLTTEVTPSGQSIVYTYNSNHQIASVAVNGATLLSNVTYEPFGAVNGWSWGNGATESRSYNQDGLVSQIVAAGVTSSYTFDNANRITGVSDSSNSALSWSYGYDALDRLTSGTTSAITDGWTYDANGNRLSQTGSAPSTYSISASSNQVSGVTGSIARTYGYNTAGMTTSYGDSTFTFNNRGRMLGVTTASGSTGYLYNALGQMVEKSAGSPSNLYVYDEAGHVLGEYDGSGNLIEETVWLGDTPVATVQPDLLSGVDVYYIHSDHLNAPRKITRPSDNALVWRIDQDPFGTAMPNQNPSGIGAFGYNLRFPGQLYLAETGLNYNYERDYDPATGRYVESDPVGLNGGSYSTYAYATGDPIDNSDSTGLAPPGRAQPFPFPRSPLPLPSSPTPESARQAGLQIEETAQYGIDALINLAKTAAHAIHNACSIVTHEQEVDDNCEALYQSTLRTCASLTGRKKFACFEAARENREQCYKEQGARKPLLGAPNE